MVKSMCQDRSSCPLSIDVCFTCLPAAKRTMQIPPNSFERHPLFDISLKSLSQELEQKKKKEEEEKAKELELTTTEEKEAGPVQELSEVKTRLDKLEETVKEIVVEAKKQSGSGVVKNQEATEASSSGSASESRTSAEKDPLSRHNSPEQRPLGEGKAREQNQKGAGKDRGIPQ